MTTIGIILWIIFILLFIGGGVALLIYGLHKHEDKGEKTTTHKIMVFGGGALILVGVILAIFFIFKYRRENRSGSIIQTQTSGMTVSQDYKQLYSQGGQMYNQGYGTGDMSGYQGMNPMNPGPYNAGFTRNPYGVEGDMNMMSSYNEMPPYAKTPIYRSDMNPMMNQWQ